MIAGKLIGVDKPTTTKPAKELNRRKLSPGKRRAGEVENEFHEVLNRHQPERGKGVFFAPYKALLRMSDVASLSSLKERKSKSAGETFFERILPAK